MKHIILKLKLLLIAVPWIAAFPASDVEPNSDQELSLFRGCGINVPWLANEVKMNPSQVEEIAEKFKIVLKVIKEAKLKVLVDKLSDIDDGVDCLDACEEYKRSAERVEELPTPNLFADLAAEIPEPEKPTVQSEPVEVEKTVAPTVPQEMKQATDADIHKDIKHGDTRRKFHSGAIKHQKNHKHKDSSSEEDSESFEEEYSWDEIGEEKEVKLICPVFVNTLKAIDEETGSTSLPIVNDCNIDLELLQNTLLENMDKPEKLVGLRATFVQLLNNIQEPSLRAVLQEILTELDEHKESCSEMCDITKNKKICQSKGIIEEEIGREEGHVIGNHQPKQDDDVGKENAPEQSDESLGKILDDIFSK